MSHATNGHQRILVIALAEASLDLIVPWAAEG